jgi:hypothetical protein
MLSLNELGVLERAPRKLGEGLAVGEHALGLHLEARLLRHRRVPAGWPNAVSLESVSRTKSGTHMKYAVRRVVNRKT